jgi:hypothetical protein
MSRLSSKSLSDTAATAAIAAIAANSDNPQKRRLQGFKFATAGSPLGPNSSPLPYH